MDNNIHKTYKQLRVLTKYGMTGICFLMTAHCGSLFFGYDALTVHLVFTLFVLFIGWKLSSIFGLCKIHRISIVYSMTVVMCVVFRRHNIFDILEWDIKTARGIMFGIGIIMSALNVWKMMSKN